MAGKSYDPLVWFLLREIWRAVPKIGWVDLCKIVAEATQMATPSPDSVRKKCTQEKWEKNIRAYCQKADSTLEKEKCQLLSELHEEYEKLQRDSSTNQGRINGGQLPALASSVFTSDVLNNVAYENRKTITVLREHRMRAGKIGQLLDNAMDWMYEAKEAVLADGQTPEQMEKAQKQFKLLEVMAEKIEGFSRTHKNLMQIDFLLYGINVDDTRDSDSEKRLGAILDEREFDQARLDLVQQYQDMQRRTDWINGGDFENEVIKQMEEQMRKDEAADAETFNEGDEDDE